MELMIWRSPGFDFDELEICQEFEGRGLGGEFDGRVEEGRGAVRAIHGGGFVDFRAKERARSIVEVEEAPPGFAQVAEAVAEVGTQCDAGSHGLRFTRRHEDTKDCLFEVHCLSFRVRQFQFVSINALFLVPETGVRLSGSRRGW